MRAVLGPAVRVYLLALVCTVLSQFYVRTTYVLTQPCPPGATCAAPVREAGWPLPWIRTALHPADEPLNLTAHGLTPPVALALDLVFYGVLIVLIGQGLRWVGQSKK
ncbi:hypothetical protein [Deinococcus radiopugnans]|uniref:YggT family protein n=1 Tax=Deinococcus radiopugnans ATCC 19172 TaxID=585398 RepID=A0ABR6NVP6_9DEIO|nr:hypothetical protein [Deinococcus radiopugnans]MBB6018097.1 hypothetical protein [Deinococcus radiopugnans ATCC 19172]